MDQIMKNQQKIKVILLGDFYVGKTSFILKVIYNQYNFQYSYPHICSSIYQKTFEYQANKRVQYQIWDNSAYQRFKRTPPIFYRGAKVVLLFYDITRKDSFQQGVKHYFKELQQKGKQQRVIAIVGNKIDLKKSQQVQQKHVRQYADSINALFFLISAKQGKGINQLLTEISYQVQKLKQSLKINQKLKKCKIQNKKSGLCY